MLGGVLSQQSACLLCMESWVLAPALCRAGMVVHASNPSPGEQEESWTMYVAWPYLKQTLPVSCLFFSFFHIYMGVTLYPFALEGKELSTLFSFKSRISGTGFCCWVVSECRWWQQPDTGSVAIVDLLLFQLSFKEWLYLHHDSNARGPESKLAFGLTGSNCVILFI